jgi:hypothetical protein
LGREHLPDMPDAALAVRACLATLLDLSQRARAATDLFGDAAVGDTLADADEHDRGGLESVLKVVFNSVVWYSGVACSAQALNLNVEIVDVSPVCMEVRDGAPGADSTRAKIASGCCTVRVS